MQVKTISAVTEWESAEGKRQPGELYSTTPRRRMESPMVNFSNLIHHDERATSIHSPIDPVRIVRYNTVQEESTTNWAAGVGPSLQSSWVSTLPVPEIRCRFTQFSSLAQDAAHLYAPEGNATPLPLNFRDCQFHSGLLISLYPTINLTNCLLERVRTEIWTDDSNVPHVRNNTVIGGTFDYLPASSPNAVIQDNLFDGALGLPDLTGWGYDGAYNAYVTNATNITFRIYPTKATDLILTSSPNYQAGPLGNYYHPINSALINRDTATAASSVGLYHYTLSTNFSGGFQIRETNSWLDTGYHYVAVNTNGLPIDTDGGGAPDGTMALPTRHSCCVSWSKRMIATMR